MSIAIPSKRIEILAPAGGREQLIAAVRTGADAVYLGAKGFNARRNAENFDAPGLGETVAFCHARNVKVNVTVNILAMDSEREALEETLKNVAESGADAVIIQDLWVADILRRRCPGIAMHASTQMSVHNLAGVKMLADLGFSRVVLARELSLSEIVKICEHSPIEIETFVHGALCMSVSGACYLSSTLGGRSGNRGLCAQPCRLDFACGHRSYALSLKDMSYIRHIAALADAGVRALKIEGRMKRPQYVAAAVSACRAALDGAEPDLESLRAVFSRGGFTDGYLTEKRGPSMFGIRSEQDAADSASVLGRLSALYRRERATVPVDFSLTIPANAPSSLCVHDGNIKLSREGSVPTQATAKPTDARLAGEILAKTGGTPFYAHKIDCDIGENLSLPASEIGRMRRAVLDGLLEARSQITPHAFAAGANHSHEPHTAAQRRFRIRAAAYAQLGHIDTAAIEQMILPTEEIEQNPAALRRFGTALCAELPALIFPGDEASLLSRLISLQKAGLSSALAENIGAVRIVRDAGLLVFGGVGLNILNTTAALEYARLGLADITLSFELAAKHIRNIGGPIQRGIIAYGYLPLMRLRACPAKSNSGCGNCTGSSHLTDRRGIRFPLLCAQKRYSTLHNSLPVYVCDQKISPLDFMTLYFTVESPEDCAKITALSQNCASADFERTRGLYFGDLL